MRVLQELYGDRRQPLCMPDLSGELCCCFASRGNTAALSHQEIPELLQVGLVIGEDLFEKFFVAWQGNRIRGRV